jgi:hypothetical protein
VTQEQILKNFLIQNMQQNSSEIIKCKFTRRDQIINRNLEFRLKDELKYKQFIKTIKSCHNPFKIKHQKQLDLEVSIDKSQGFGDKKILNKNNNVNQVEMDKNMLKNVDEESVMHFNEESFIDKRNAADLEEKEYLEFNRKMVKGSGGYVVICFND